ncbi:hypothetical protein GCM10027535_39120 [Mycolicibacterium hippocampi]
MELAGSPLLREVPAVDGEHGAGDEGSVVGGEEDDGAGNFGGFADADHRVHVFDRRQVLRATGFLRELLDVRCGRTSPDRMCVTAGGYEVEASS